MFISKMKLYIVISGVIKGNLSGAWIIVDNGWFILGIFYYFCITTQILTNNYE